MDKIKDNRDDMTRDELIRSYMLVMGINKLQAELLADIHLGKVKSDAVIVKGQQNESES